ncbi:UvrD-helicase domain-containing protein [Bacillus suaedae]|uniref:DNA 3'-5' helicase n=1 Tax=Halalkalibacter suaedae TaxID=2822140 RepID=A0A940WPT9_9BACI|nr:UvrD-helicase domain-containing protein [Bacillus suaedae]
MDFNQPQQQAITSDKKLILVSAGAGSGKTRVLTERFIHLCELHFVDKEHPAGATVEEMVAITFTEKAAREMKDRIRKRIIEKVEEAGSEQERFYWIQQKESMERALISTFHSFCQRLLSQHALKADLPPRTRIIDQVEAKSKKKELINAILEERAFNLHAVSFLQMMSKNQLIETIEQVHDDVREFVVGEDAITSLEAKRMLEKQCEGKREEQRKATANFHKEALRCIHNFPPLSEVTAAQKKHLERISAAFQNLELQDDTATYMELLHDVMPSKTSKAWQEKAPALFELFEEYWKPLKEKWKQIGGTPVIDSEVQTYTESFIILLKEFYSRYSLEKKKAGLLDFTDLQQKAVTLLADPVIKNACQQQFRHIMVDEFQDTNRLQLEMLERMEPAYQFIVGDQKQSIYRFRGANVRLMNEREELATRLSDAEVIHMNTNYRTTAPVIHAVNDLFEKIMASERKESYETVYAPLDPARSGQTDNEQRVELLVLPKDEEREETQYDILTNRMLEMMTEKSPSVFNGDWRSPKWGDMVVLIPTRTNLLLLERSLLKKNIPYVISGGIGFYGRQEIIDFITLLRWLNRPFEELYLLAVLRSPLCGLTLDDFYTLKESIQENQSLFELVYEHENSIELPNQIKEACVLIQSWLNRWTPFVLHQSIEHKLYELFIETGLRASLLLQSNGLQKVKNVEKLIELITASHETDLETIVAELEERIVLSEKEGDSEVERVNGDVVQIMTVHASKGLEFPIVFLPQIERQTRADQGSVRFHPTYGLVLQLKQDELELDQKETVYESPGFALVKDVSDAEAREESKRLFYVAMTRARDYLYMIGEESTSANTWLQMTEQALEEGDLSKRMLISEITEQKEPLIQEAPKLKEIEQLKPEPVTIPFTVSEIVSFIHDPVDYYYRFVIGVPYSIKEKSKTIINVANEGNKIDPSILGTLVHRACELRDLGLSIENAIEETLEEADIQSLTSYKEEMLLLMKNYTDVQRKALGRPVANEWSFVTMLEGAEIIGEIDKVVEKDGQLHIIDFKTNRIHDSGAELVDHYKAQLYLYKLAYEQETGQLITSISLYVLRDLEHPLHTITITEKDEQRILDAFRQLVKLRQSNNGKEAYISARSKE